VNRYKSAALPLGLFYAALIVYASLFPFTGWRDQGLAPWAFLWAPWPQYWTRFDLVANLAGYAPLGFLLALALMRMRRAWPAVTLASTAAALLSFTMESLQSYLPLRVASNLDLGLNAAGGVLGALLAFVLERLGAIDRWRRFRARWFVRNSRGALVLLALWPVGLLFPAPVAFGLGQVWERLEEGVAELLQDTPFIEWLPLRELELQPLLPGAELVCVALGALVPCLLGYTVVRHRGRRVLFALSALLVGIGVSALSAGLSYGPVHAWAWLNQPVQLGLLLAALAALLLLPMPGRVCVLALMLVLVVQVLLLNAAPQSPYFAVTLQGWEQGRFIHFHGLAQWVGWLWPYAAFIYLLTRLGRPDGGQPPAEPARRSPVLAAAELVTLDDAQSPNSAPNPASPPMDTPMPPAPPVGAEPRIGA
jgi:VanZ family protein